jgi:AcrR family transcriptional regulator
MVARAGLDAATVVRTAANLADEMGIEHVTLAAVAARLGVRIPSLYNHVNGLPGLRRELALHGIRELNKRLQKAAIGKESDRAIESMLYAYRSFAKERPGLYQATLHAPDPEDREIQKASQEIIETVLAGLESFHLEHEDALHVVRAFRSIAHGFVSLEATGGFGLSLDTDESYRRLVSVFLRGLHADSQGNENERSD